MVAAAQGSTTRRDPPSSLFQHKTTVHSSFAMEQVSQEFSAPPQLGHECSCVFRKVGDLVTDCTLQVRVTKPSNAYPSIGKAAYFPAEHLIKEVSLSIGGVTIDRHTSDWLRIYDSYFRHADASYQYERCTNFDATTILSATSFTETLYLPLSFWFCREYADALPLVALWDEEVKLVVVFRSAEEAGVLADSFSARIYLTTVYLDTPERDALCHRPLVYRPEVVQMDVRGLDELQRPSEAGPVMVTKRLNLQFWLKALWFVFINTGANAGHARFVGDEDYTVLALQPNQFSPSGLALVQTISEKLAPVQSASLSFDGIHRYNDRPGTYYNKVQAARYSARAPLPGVYMCSFCLRPTEVGYSGGCHVSNLDVELAIRLKQSVPAGVNDAEFSGINAERLAKNTLNLTELQVFALTTRIMTVADGRATLVN